MNKLGPVQNYLADSTLPDLDTLEHTIIRPQSVKRPIAAHYVSRESLSILISVLDEVGSISGDRFEYGALIPRESIDETHRVGLVVASQPESTCAPLQRLSRSC